MNEKPKILIVDDEPYARQAIEMLLLKESYELFFAEDAHEALAQLDDEIPDVILSDVMMPNMDGFELCQRIKRNPKWNHVPIILVTALDSKQDLARGLEAGADDFLHKPINGLELRARVRSMLRIKLRHDELQAALQMRQDLANMIVHDIRSPLSTILIYCDLLEAELEGKNLQTLETIRGEANRLSSFLTDMLMMAKMEHGRLMLSQSPVDMNELATAVRDSYAPMAQLKEIDLELDLPHESNKMLLDANLWRRVLDNLVSNAVKFSPTGGHVTLKVRYDSKGPTGQNGSGKHLNVQVIDEGPGIAQEHHETIFDKFKIVATGRRDVKQVGLGLAFCKMVVEAHNGRISVSANEPRGSIFTVEL